MPRAELLLWTHLKGKQLAGLKFRRQYSVVKYIVDFYCPKLKLAIEIDGDSHFENKVELLDPKRQRYIESFGIRVLRFTNHDIYYDTEKVLKKITEALEQTSPNPYL